MNTARPLRIDVLPLPQQRLWRELEQVPPEFVLYGGTAIALQIGHRESIDFDFFSHMPLDQNSLDLNLPLLRGAEITQREPNSLSAIVDRDGPVKVSFFGVPKLPRLLPPIAAPDHGLKIASLLDLAGTKVSIVQMRAEIKDYLDIDALVSLGGLRLEYALASASLLYGPNFNPQAALKALVYFEDESLRDLPNDVRLRLVNNVKAIDLACLPQMPKPIYLPQP